MKTRTAFILSFTAILTLAAGSAFGKYSGGTGTADGPYRIGTATDLLALAANTGDYDANFIITADINLAGVTMNPIGNDSNTFTGIFNGNGHIIRNMVINAPSVRYIALFGYIGPGGQVKNLGVEDINLTGNYYMGALAGYSEGAITSCYATGVVVGNDSVIGGLVGYSGNTSAITDCYATCSVSGESYVGGLAAASDGDINSCYATGAVSGSYIVGGLVGDNTGTMVSCYSTGAVSGTDQVGGLAGINNDTLTSCYATGSVSGTDYVGGLVGANNGTLTACYVSGSVSGTHYVGGLAGDNNDTLTACFWDTQASGLTEGVGSGSSAGVYGKTTAQMKTQATFTAAGWDFVGETVNGPNGIWAMPSAGSYPILSWQTFVTIGTGTGSWEWPLQVYNYYARTQTIYLASEIGSARTLTSLAIDVTVLPGLPLNNFTIRLTHTNLAAYAYAYKDNLWISADWTTVYQSNETFSAKGWRTFIFTTPFSYNGTDNLMVDISFRNFEWSWSGQCSCSSPGDRRSIYYNNDSNYYNNPLTWTGNSPPPASSTFVPNIRLGFILASIVDVPVPLDFHGTKCAVTAGSKSNSDAISFSGTIDANADDFNDANNSPDANFVKVTINDANAEYMDPCVFTFPVNGKTWKKGKFSSTITSKPLKMSFAFDTKKKTFSFSASNVDLTGLSCPVAVTIQIGSSSGYVSLDETIVNGTKKLIPYQLMMGAGNSLVADKVSFKRSSKPDANSLTVSGRFTTTSGPDLPTNPMVITVGSQTFTVPGDKFLNKKGIVSCSKAVPNEGSLVRVTAKLDYVKCTFSISIKYASIIQTGVVDFGINCFGVNLDGLETIDLGP